MRAFIVGQHAPIVPEEIEIVGKANVTFVSEVIGVVTQLTDLATQAALAGADTLLLQNTPVIVSAALIEMKGTALPVNIGGIISRQGKREGDKETIFEVGTYDPDNLPYINETGISKAIVAANGNAKVSFSYENKDILCKVAVAQAAKFEFDKIVQLL